MLIFHEAVLEVTIAFSLAYILYPNPTSGLYYSPLLGTGAQAGEEQDITFLRSRASVFEKHRRRGKRAQNNRRCWWAPIPVAVRGETSEILYIIAFVIRVHDQYDTKEEQCHGRV